MGRFHGKPSSRKCTAADGVKRTTRTRDSTTGTGRHARGMRRSVTRRGRSRRDARARGSADRVRRVEGRRLFQGDDGAVELAGRGEHLLEQSQREGGLGDRFEVEGQVRGIDPSPDAFTGPGRGEGAGEVAFQAGPGGRIRHPFRTPHSPEAARVMPNVIDGAPCTEPTLASRVVRIPSTERDEQRREKKSPHSLNARCGKQLHRRSAGSV